jgi:cysteinyl-tRNA synthetase
VEVAPYKRDPMDFVLWKPSSPEEPGWDSPWGRGRPGWHIECSAMSEKHLGEVFDIHGGGIDLAFPHHENELAQSRCAHGTELMAQVWMHNGFLQVEGRKMAKSEGNFVTISELLNTEKFGGRKWPGEVLRLAMLMTHYREPIDFSIARLEEAEQKLRDWQRAAGAATRGVPVPPEPTVIAALLDDLSFHRASVTMDVIARKANRGSQTAADCLAATLEFFGFGLDTLLQDSAVSAEASAGIERAVSDRLAALNAKDFAAADRIRADLLEQGIQLMDSKNAAGERVTTWEVKR